MQPLCRPAAVRSDRRRALIPARSSEGVRAILGRVLAEGERQNRGFGFGAERPVDATAAVALEHEVLDESTVFGSCAVGRNIQAQREQRSVHGADERGAGALPNFNGQEFGAALLEANLGMSDHSAFKPAGSE